MGSFGNYLGATMGTSTNEEGRSGAIYDNSWVTNSNYPQRAALLDSNDGDGDGNTNEFVVVEDVDIDDIPEDPNAKVPGEFGEVPGLLSDDTAYNKVRDELTGGSGLNWETFTFAQLREEKDALNTEAIDNLADAWKTHGDDLKRESETFKTSVHDAITGKWEGASATAAEAATQQVTKTSIYDFTPSSQALSDRLDALKISFDHIKSQFPDTSFGQLIGDEGNFNQEGLDDAIDSFNSRYHLDGDGRLRNNTDGYVTAADALRELEEINRSIRDYERAVQLFRDTYNPTVEQVTENFPVLPPPPNMQYGPNGPGPTGPGPTGPGPTGPGPTGPGPTGPGTPPFNTPKFDTPPTTTPDIGKTPPIPDPQTGTGDQTPINDPQSWPVTNPQGGPATTNPTQAASQGLKSGLDAATQGMKSGLDAATQAAQQAAQKAAQGAAGQKPIPSLREGALGLGDKPGAPKGLGGGAAGGGGAGAGGSGGGLPANQPAARLSTESASGARPAVPAASTSSMGATGGMGAPGMGGGPAAGGRGNDGKEHKGNKALRTRKNGSDIVGDTDAVVPVLGDSPPPAEETQPAPPHRRIPGQRGTSWQPDSAVQSSPRRSPQAQDPSSTTTEQLMDQ